MKPMMMFLFVFIVMFMGCSGSQFRNDDLKIEIISQKIDAWVNLMPGSKPSFYVSGSLTIRNNENTLIDSIKVLECQVFQQHKTLYELHPVLRGAGNVTEPLIPGTSRTCFLFFPDGNPVIKELDLEKPVSIELFLSAFNKVKQHTIDSIFVLKTF